MRIELPDVAAVVSACAAWALRKTIPAAIKPRRSICIDKYAWLIAISLRQDEFVLSGEAQPIEFIAVRNSDFTGADEEIVAKETIVGQWNLPPRSGSTLLDPSITRAVFAPRCIHLASLA
jgi:hypothetical protein